MCATFIPGFSGIFPPVFRGARHIDGGFTDNCPCIDQHTVSVSPYAGEADICPKDGVPTQLVFNVSNTSFEFTTRNLFRLLSTFCPPKPEVLSDICQQGFDDALKFLVLNNLIECQPCVMSTASAGILSEIMDMYATSCSECLSLKEKALANPRLPEPVRKILQDGIDAGKKGLINWLYSHQSVRILSLMSLPWALSADLAYATGVKLFDSVPKPNISSPDMKTLKIALSPLVSQPLVSQLDGSPSSSFVPSPTIVIEPGESDLGINPELQLRLLPSSDSNYYGYEGLDSLDIVSEYPDAVRRASIFEDWAEDSFERTLRVTAQHDSVVANYYSQQDSELSF